jgi:hypothetical protein
VALNPHLLAGSTALVVALLLLVVYFYRRRLFIVWGMAAWLLQSASLLMVSRSYGSARRTGPRHLAVSRRPQLARVRRRG